MHNYELCYSVIVLRSGTDPMLLLILLFLLLLGWPSTKKPNHLARLF